MGNRQIWTVWLIAMALTATWGTASAQTAGELLERERRLRALKTQEIEAAVNSALRAALARPGPAAETRLRAAQARVDAATRLDPAKRRELTARLQTALRSATRRRRTALPSRGPLPLTGGVPSRAPKPPTGLGGSEAVRRELSVIADLEQAGKYVEAERRANALAKNYPDNPAAQVMVQRSALRRRLADAQGLYASRRARRLAASKSADESAIPPAGDVSYPKDWAEKSKRRSAPRLTGKEQKLMAALEKPISVNVTGQPLAAFVKTMSERIGQPIIIDKTALKVADVDPSARVEVSLSDVSTRTALRVALSQLGLTFLVRNEVIRVTTVQAARLQMVTRVYYLGDLLEGNNTDFRNPFAEYNRRFNAATIVQLVKSIDPYSWEGNGGAGTIFFHQTTRALVVRQTAEVHSALAGKFPR